MNTNFTSRAVAYLKAALPEDDSPAVTLSQADSPIVQALCDGLCVCYVVDECNSYHYVQERHLAQDGISRNDLHGIGIRNLTELASRRDLRVQPYQSIFAVLMGGDFEASLILLDQVWELHFRQFVSGEYAIAIPARDILSFCDNSSAQGIRELKQLISRVTPNGDHLISDRIYVRRDGRFVMREAA